MGNQRNREDLGMSAKIVDDGGDGDFRSFIGRVAVYPS